ncbi:MAG TPA: O-methyltransferase [Muribaculum sp.]|jgi:predicted O-methyltransferase YrrM|uniref:O-methyltransferase n=1 Tax=Heminiphilus faecis TaxID=2601703 RepID=A0ABV4CY88_9BACT|nr:O-methyltransferase [Heminiphilus faecis]RLT75570.1 O-methyltransferase [bacterium J10(2018)]HRF69478.1 O-methyltransferase [Muribaculum sp.]
MQPTLEEYILGHIDPEPDHLKKLNRDTHVTCLYANMCSGHLQGRLLKMLTRMIKPKRVLELGTFTGYSALCLAEGMEEGTEIHTIEINDELEEFILSHIDESPCGGRIHLHIGDASEILPAIGGEWDLVFIDANKRRYTEYYEAVMPHVRQGGFIIADNTLWYGKVTDGSHDAQTAGILEFNDHVASDPRVEKVMIPLRDGLTIIYKK